MKPRKRKKPESKRYILEKPIIRAWIICGQVKHHLPGWGGGEGLMVTCPISITGGRVGWEGVGGCHVAVRAGFWWTLVSGLVAGLQGCFQLGSESREDTREAWERAGPRHQHPPREEDSEDLRGHRRDTRREGMMGNQNIPNTFHGIQFMFTQAPRAVSSHTGFAGTPSPPHTPATVKMVDPSLQADLPLLTLGRAGGGLGQTPQGPRCS